VRQVLWAEDNPDDRLLIRTAVAELPSPPDVKLVNDGVFLLQELGQALPGLVVLDLRMPRLGGLEALAAMRANPAWRGLPVAIFSAGNQPEETARCRALGALLVVQKPVNYLQFTAAVHSIVQLESEASCTTQGF
jgi:CheY-like chemotaxis protein